MLEIPLQTEPWSTFFWPSANDVKMLIGLLAVGALCGFGRTALLGIKPERLSFLFGDGLHIIERNCIDARPPA